MPVDEQKQAAYEELVRRGAITPDKQPVVNELVSRGVLRSSTPAAVGSPVQQLGQAMGDFAGGNAREVSDTYKAEQAEKPIGPLSSLNYDRELIRRQNPNLTETQVSDMARATRMDRRNTPTMRSNPPEPERNIVQKVIAGTGKALSYPQAPVKAALYNLGKVTGLDKPVLEGDIEEQKKLDSMNFFQKMNELKDQPLRNLGKPETEIYNSKRYENTPAVGKALENVGQMGADIATNPLTYAMGGLGPKAHVAANAAFTATQIAPLLEHPELFATDPIRASMDLGMAALGAHGLRSSIKSARTAPIEPQPTSHPLGTSVGERLTTPETTAPTVEPETILTPKVEEPANATVPTKPLESSAEETLQPSGTGKTVTSRGSGKSKGNVKPVQPVADTRPASPAQASTEASPAQAKETVSTGEAKSGPVQPNDVVQTSARKAMMTEDRKNLGLDELPPAEKKPWQQALDNAKKQGLDDPDKAQALVKSVLDKPSALNDEQTAGLVLRAAKLKNNHAELLKSLDTETDPEIIGNKREAMKIVEEEFNKTSDALKQSGTEKGRNLAAQKLTINQDYDLLSVKARAKAEKGGPISEKRAKAYESVVSERDALQEKLNRLEQQSLSRQMRNSPSDPKSAEFGKSNKLFTKERADLARQRLQEKLGGKLSAGIDPTILKDAVELGGYYLEGGIRSFAVWAKQLKTDNPNLDDEHIRAAWSQLTNDKRLGMAKKSLTRSLQDIQGRVDNGGEAPVKPPKIEYDAEYYNLKKQRDAASYKLEQMIAAEHKPHPMDYVNAVHRFSILSGMSSAAKIGLASAERVSLDTVESIFGTVMSKVPGLKTVAEKAPGEGTGRIRDDVAAFVKAWSLPDMWQKVKGQPSSVDKGYFEATGKHPDVREGGPVMQMLELPGRIHAAIKLPAQRAAWQRGMARRAAYEIRQGNDIHEPAVQIRIAEGAYADSLNAIFRGDNIITTGWNRGMQSLETYSKGPNKGAAIAAKALQVALRLEVPIIRIPTNLAIESTMYSPIGVARAAIEVIASKGVKNLTPAQADIVMRSSKKGLIGTALMATAWQLAKKGDLEVADKDDEYEGLKHGDMRLFGMRIPNIATHHPALMAIKTTVSMQKAYDESEETGAMRVVESAAHGATQTAKEIPFTSNLQSLSQAMRNGKGLVNHVKKVGKSFIPRDAKELVPQ